MQISNFMNIVQWEPSFSMWTDGQTHSYGKVCICFLQFCECAEKCVIHQACQLIMLKVSILALQREICWSHIKHCFHFYFLPVPDVSNLSPPPQCQYVRLWYMIAT
jgi:hypothetical protein